MTKERTMYPQDYYRMKALSEAPAGLCEESEKPVEKLLQFYIEGKLPYSPFHLVTSNNPANVDKMEMFIKILETKKTEKKISKEEKEFLDYLLEMTEFKKNYNNPPILQILKEDLLDPKIAKIKNHQLVRRVRELIKRRVA